LPSFLLPITLFIAATPTIELPLRRCAAAILRRRFMPSPPLSSLLRQLHYASAVMPLIEPMLLLFILRRHCRHFRLCFRRHAIALSIRR